MKTGSEPLLFAEQTDEHIDFDLNGTDPEEEYEIGIPDPRQGRTPLQIPTGTFRKLVWDSTLQRYILVYEELLLVNLLYEDDSICDCIRAIRIDYKSPEAMSTPTINPTLVVVPATSPGHQGLRQRTTSLSSDSSSPESCPSTMASPQPSPDTLPEGHPEKEGATAGQLPAWRLRYMKLGVIHDNFKRIELADDEPVLVICCKSHCGLGKLTDYGAQMLHKDNPELFATAEEAGEAFRAAFLEASNSDIDTQEYQAFARLIQRHEERDTLIHILGCESWWTKEVTAPSAYVQQVPSGMLRSGYLRFRGYDDSFHIDADWEHRYKRFRKELAFTSSMKKMLCREDLGDKEKVETLLSLFPPEKDQVTLDELMKNAEFLFGSLYEQARASFLDIAQK